MNEIIAEVRNLLIDKYPEIIPVFDRLKSSESSIDEKYGTFCISHRPNIAPKAYALWIFPGVDEETIQRYEKINSINIPSFYRELLYVINGALIFELDLFGIPLSMAKEPPLLDRSTITPKDISLANKNSKNEYYDIKDSLFYFGTSPWNFDENVGHFLNEVGIVYSFRSSGEQVGQWGTINQFFKDEIERVEKEYPKHEEFMSNLLSNVNKKSWWKFWA